MLTGSRIRSRRLALGLGQGALANEVGISASYLNLIEHNRRRIGGKLLVALARALSLDPGPLADGDMALIAALRLAGAGFAPDAGTGPKVELDAAGDFAGRFPGWAALVHAQAGQIERLQSRVADLTARMTHDPALAGSLHDVISAVTAIRSAAAILVSGEGIDPDWQARFHRNINADARRLAATARGLVDYLERPVDAAEPRTPREAADRWLDARGHHLPEVEAGLDPTLPEGPAGDLLRQWVAVYRADARRLPLPEFATAAMRLDHDPAALARHFDMPLAPVLRRLASLPPPHPAMGLIICDGAGVITQFKAVAGLALSRAAANCPLWPLYQSLGQPGRPLRCDVALAGMPTGTLRCTAIADPVAPDFDAVPRNIGVMLIQTGLPTLPGRVQQVGPSCRLCPAETCTARREPSLLG